MKRARAALPTRRVFCRGGLATAFFAPVQLGSLSTEILARDTAATKRVSDIETVARRRFKQLSEQGLPGAVFGIQTRDDEERLFALGNADVTTGEPMSTKMTMRLGSVAKLFVGTLALQLVDDGVITLDDTVSAFRSDVPRGGEITLRMLGNHTSGLFNVLRDPGFRQRVNRQPARQIGREEVFEAAFTRSGDIDPGGEFAYSNTNTMLLADILERAAGIRLDALLLERLLKPFAAPGIHLPTSSALSAPAPRGYRFGATSGAIEYGQVFFDATQFNASWAGAAGNMNGTVGDLLKLATPLASGATLTPRSRAEMRRFIPVGSHFDYGFCLARYGGAFGHAGDVPGFSSFVAWDQSSDTTVVVIANLSNLADKTAPATRLGRSLLAGSS